MICLSYDGSIIDACLLALLASLQNSINVMLMVAKLPNVTLDDDLQLVASKDFTPLKLSRAVICTTFCLFDGYELDDKT
jgi:exosome complex RNA-binding protein Rrp42 (RNase PH superfamily)